MASYVPNKIDLKPRRHHGYAVVLFILGTLLPPLAVAARFGIGKDFWLNCLLTLCGYIPGHGHNFYIQNIRNNKNHARTPKWAQRYGLVDTSEIPTQGTEVPMGESTLEDQPYEEGQNSSLSLSSDDHDARPRQQGDALWRPEDEQFYGNNQAAASRSSGRWHYPANFDDAVVSSSGSKRGKKKKEKKDRWARTEDAYSLSEQQQRKKAKKKKSRASMSTVSRDESTEFPEDPEGGLYGDRQNGNVDAQRENQRSQTTDDVFSHQF
ncbi:hypothetical protein D9758_003345 [Tetrapyrgos nigripes]|uniref:Uncharacterized protein n=1 Tax=Tetrapyrgos nigripes TaxID=182062 RepID=A0A8H5LQH4_9AGAR|nr:hypothetical protein D9758_003345 [Tetrapyrgos nigripes]